MRASKERAEKALQALHRIHQRSYDHQRIQSDREFNLIEDFLKAAKTELPTRDREKLESERPHTGKPCSCGQQPSIQQIHTGKQWQYAYVWQIVCQCGQQTPRSTALGDVIKFWDNEWEVKR